MYIYVCASARVIKHSRFKANTCVEERVGGGIFFSLGTALSQNRRDLPFFSIKNLSQILPHSTKGVFFFLLSNE